MYNRPPVPEHFIDFPQEIHPERLIALEKIGDYEGKKILDVGCGNHKTHPSFMGIDILPVTDIQSSGDDLSMFSNGSVDGIISRHSFEHIQDSVKTLREWSRVLKKSGKIVMVLPDDAKMDTMAPKISSNLHLHAYTIESLKNLISLFSDLSVSDSGVVIDNWSFYCVIIKI